MKKRYYLILALAALTMSACGSKSEKAEESETDEIGIEEVETIDPYKETSEDLSGTDESTVTESEAETKENGKIDDMISELSKLVKECKDYLPQLKDGKVELTKVMSLVDKAKSLQTSLNGLKADMSSVQLSQFNDITSQLSSVAGSITDFKPSEIIEKAKDKGVEVVKEKASETADKAMEAAKKKLGF